MQGQPGPHCEVLLQTQTKQANRMGTLNVYIVMDLRASSSGKSPGHCVALDNGHRCPESIFERKKNNSFKSPCFEAEQLGLPLHSQLLGSLGSQVLGVSGSERPKPATPLPTDQLWKKPNSQTLLHHGHAHKPQFPHKLIVASPALQKTQ